MKDVDRTVRSSQDKHLKEGTLRHLHPATTTDGAGEVSKASSCILVEGLPPKPDVATIGRVRLVEPEPASSMYRPATPTPAIHPPAPGEARLVSEGRLRHRGHRLMVPSTVQPQRSMTTSGLI